MFGTGNDETRKHPKTNTILMELFENLFRLLYIFDPSFALCFVPLTSTLDDDQELSFVDENLYVHIISKCILFFIWGKTVFCPLFSCSYERSTPCHTSEVFHFIAEMDTRVSRLPVLFFLKRKVLHIFPKNIHIHSIHIYIYVVLM